MYPQMNNNVDYETLTNDNNMTEDNKKLCIDLCKVGICLSCFCSVYLILFLGVIDQELNMNITMIT